MEVFSEGGVSGIMDSASETAIGGKMWPVRPRWPASTSWPDLPDWPGMEPIFASSYWTVLVGLSVIVYFGSDAFYWHHSRTARRGFWYIVSSTVLFWLISLIQKIDFNTFHAYLVVLLGVLFASTMEDRLQKNIYLTRFQAQSTFDIPGSPEAEGKADYLGELVKSLNSGRGYTVGTAQLVSQVAGSFNRRLRALHEIIATADTGELNYILANINVGKMLEVASPETIELLTSPDQRLPELTTYSRGALIDGFQKVGLRYRSLRQHYAKNIIMATRGSQLTQLKGYLDDGGDWHTLYKLIYNDLQGSIQRDVLEHISNEGKQALAEHTRRILPGARAIPGIALKIVSDIDDTLLCGGGFPAGSDLRYPKKAIYPGVLALYSEMDVGHALRAQGPEGVDPGPLETASSQSGMSDRSDSESVASPRRRSSWGSGAQRLSRGRGGVGGSARMSRKPSGLLGTRVGEDLGLHDLPDRSAVQEVLWGGGRVYDDDDEESESMMKFAPLRKLQRWVTSARSMGRSALVGLLKPSRQAWQAPMSENMAPALQAADSAQPGLELEADQRPHQAGANLVFLSARPETYKGLTEAESYRSIFNPLMRRGELYCSPVLLLGSLDSSARAIWSYALGSDKPKDSPNTLDASFYRALAGKKLQRFREYAALYPECCFVFVGDNGQGDVLVAEALSKIFAPRAGASSRLLASFVHKVVPVAETISSLKNTKSNKEAWMASWRDHKIYLQDTHVGMAVQAYTLGLIDELGLHHVAASACKDLRWCRARYANEKVDWAANTKLLNRDIRRANEVLLDHMQVSPIQLPDAQRPQPGALGPASSFGSRPSGKPPLGRSSGGTMRSAASAESGSEVDSRQATPASTPVKRGQEPATQHNHRLGPGDLPFAKVD